MQKDDLGNRMKNLYEVRSKTFLVRKIPVIIRLDGKCFHTFCKRFNKPYDDFFNNCMRIVMSYLCKRVQGVKFAERHSDEISLLLTDTDSEKTEAFFDYEVQKICSIVASWASTVLCRKLIDSHSLSDEEDPPVLDCRCFNIPENEISNYFWWRSLDATHNSIQANAQSKFNHKQLLNKNTKQMQEMLFSKHNLNWSKLPQEQKSGMICFKTSSPKEMVLCQACGMVSPKDKPIKHRDSCHSSKEIEPFTVDRKKWFTEASPATWTELNSKILDILYK